jgi:hypothetical protein
VAQSVFRFGVSTVTHPEKRAWAGWNYRAAVKDLVRVHEHGWTETASETTETIFKLVQLIAVYEEVPA